MKSLIREQVIRLYEWVYKPSLNEYNKNELSQSAIVFSPHFDDETLGCGGIMIKKKRAGADIKLVFMTDGSKSHSHLIPENELKTIRANEGIAAAQSMGIDAGDVFLLGFEETKLKEHHDSAVAKVRQIIQEQQPKEIFIPYHQEPLLWSEDHLCTTKIVKSALQSYGKNVVIYEYPIWFWLHWPWVDLINKNSSLTRIIVKHTLMYGLGSRLLRDFQCSMYIGDVLEQKHATLAEHKSQMTSLIPDSKWSTLNDVSNGKFLQCFFQEREVFRRYHHSVI
ncbi:MAG: PIG-L deacetylase family protein [Calothrix sp. MO_192.B10]|nr:PIG-L deacetylase family protein [Calothrix sp. MO_192.B10]